MIHIYSLSESNIVGFIARIAIGQKPYILAIDPLFPPSRRFLQVLVDVFVRRGRAGWLVELTPDIAPEWEYPTFILRRDIFRKSESWQNAHFGFGRRDSRDESYGRCFRHETCKYVAGHYREVIALDDFAKRSSPDGYAVHGLSPDVAGLYAAYLGRVPPAAIRWAPSRLINALVQILILFYAAFYIARRTRLRVAARHFSFAADCNQDPRDHYLFDELKDAAPLLLVLRTADARAGIDERMAAENVLCEVSDGRFTPMDAVVTFGMVVANSMGILRRYGDLESGLFYALATLPFRRMQWRSFFNVFQPAFFWGRDDYQVEHLLRKDEIHRQGGVSMGISHAVQGIATLIPAWRYLDFDIYYLMANVFHAYYKDTWRDGMRVRAVGSFGFPRARLVEARTPSRDILFLSRFTVGNPAFVEMVRAVATAFPDRRVLVQVKNNYPHDKLIPGFIAQCTQGLTNVFPVSDYVYDLIWNASVVISDPSTVVAEAILLGIPSFVADIIPGHETCIFREFPGLCFKDAAGLVPAVKSVVADPACYPRESYSELVPLNAMNIYDIVRADIGLPPQHN